jgi:ankyrin repeat protein
MLMAVSGSFDAIISRRAFQRLDFQNISAAEPRLTRDTIVWLLLQKVISEKDYSDLHDRNLHPFLRKTVVLWGVCSLAVLYQGRLSICERLSDPAPTHLVQRLLLNQLAVICYIGNEDIVRSLVAQGNDVNAEDEFLGTPLYAATHSGQEGIVDILLKHEANPNVRGYSRAPLVVDTRDDEVLLWTREQNPNQIGPQGVTALWLSCSYGYTGIVRLLLNHRQIDVNLKCGGMSPLAVAASRGHETVVRWLLEREDLWVDLQNRIHCPLWYATMGGHARVLKLLLDKLHVGADDYKWNSRTLLWWAASWGHPSVAQMLLNRSDVNPNYHRGDGNTPLWEAATYGHIDVVAYLLQRQDIDPNISSWTPSNTPLWTALWRRHANVMDLLLRCKAVNPNSRGHDMLTPLSGACLSGQTLMVKMLLKRMDTDVNKADYCLRTAASYACQKGYDAILQLLLKRSDLELDKADDDGRTPLSRAGENGHVKVVQLLLEHRPALINVQDKDRSTCLMKASEKGHLAVVQLLLNFNADVHLKDRNHRTALCIAQQGRYRNIEACLKEHNSTSRIKQLSTNSWTPLRIESA